MALKNRFGWSLSRESLFDSCRKRYYFHYYQSWGGWNRSSSEASRESFLLKRLVSLALWRGQLVHYIATKVLQSTRARGYIPDIRKVLDYAEERFLKQYEFSAQRRYLDTPKKDRGRLRIDWLALFDHEYGLEIQPGRLERTRAEVMEGVRNLLESSLLKRAASSDPGEWVIENIDISEFAQSFQVEGVRVFVKTDFIFREREGTLNIVDWKTYRNKGGARTDAMGQLGVYGYYAVTMIGEPCGNLILTEVNLLDSAAEKAYRMDEELLESSKGIVISGIDKLSSVIEDGDIERNKPLPPENFPANPGNQCRFCNFNRICVEAADTPG